MRNINLNLTPGEFILFECFCVAGTLGGGFIFMCGAPTLSNHPCGAACLCLSMTTCIVSLSMAIIAATNFHQN